MSVELFSPGQGCLSLEKEGSLLCFLRPPVGISWNFGSPPTALWRPSHPGPQTGQWLPGHHRISQQKQLLSRLFSINAQDVTWKTSTLKTTERGTARLTAAETTVNVLTVSVFLAGLSLINIFTACPANIVSVLHQARQIYPKDSKKVKSQHVSPKPLLVFLFDKLHLNDIMLDVLQMLLLTKV